MRSSMMVRRESDSVDTYVIGAEACKLLSAVSGISDVKVENQYLDRATLSFDWEAGRSNFDARLDFTEIDQNLEAKGMHRMR